MYLGTGHPEHGADMNIRGGQAGFMRSLAEGQFLAWPDYVGKLGVLTVAWSFQTAIKTWVPMGFIFKSDCTATMR